MVLLIIPFKGSPIFIAQGVNFVPHFTNQLLPMDANRNFALFNSASVLYSKAFAVLSNEMTAGFMWQILVANIVVSGFGFRVSGFAYIRIEKRETINAKRGLKMLQQFLHQPILLHVISQNK